MNAIGPLWACVGETKGAPIGLVIKNAPASHGNRRVRYGVEGAISPLD